MHSKGKKIRIIIIIYLIALIGLFAIAFALLNAINKNGVVIIKWTRKIRENEKGHNYDKKALFKRI